MLLTAFCITAFAMGVPQQDTSKLKQQHHAKMAKNTSKKKMKNWKKANSTGKDTMNNKAGGMHSTMKPAK